MGNASGHLSRSLPTFPEIGLQPRWNGCLSSFHKGKVRRPEVIETQNLIVSALPSPHSPWRRSQLRSRQVVSSDN